eukprot:gene1846-16339_t
MKDPQTVTVKWKDTKDVMLISTMCPATPGPNDKIRKSQKESAEKEEANKRGQKAFRIELYKGPTGSLSSRKKDAGQLPNASARFDGIR